MDLPEPDTRLSPRSAPQRERHVDAAQIVLTSAFDGQLTALIGLPAFGRDNDAPRTRKISAGNGFRILQQVFVRTAVDNLATVFTRGGTDVDHPVRVRDGVFVVLDHDERVAEILEPREGFL